jgi:hypothetical protein
MADVARQSFKGHAVVGFKMHGGVQAQPLHVRAMFLFESGSSGMAP